MDTTLIDFFRAVEHGDALKVALMLRQGIHVDEKSVFGSTALQLAAEYGLYDVATVLLEHKPDLYIFDRHEATAIGRAAHKGHIKMVEILLDAGFGINEISFDRHTLLYHAVDGQNEELLELLLRRGADPHKKFHPCDSSLELALVGEGKRKASTVFVLRMIKACDINRQDDKGNTVLINLLHNTSSDYILESAELLLRNGANPNIQNKDGQTALIQAILYYVDDYTEPLIKQLLQYGAEKNIADNEGLTAKVYAHMINRSTQLANIM